MCLRGEGTTTRQMLDAPKGAVFIWPHGNITYPMALAAKIDRRDLLIVGPIFLDNEQWLGMELTGLVLDHSAILTDRQWDSFRMAKHLMTSRCKTAHALIPASSAFRAHCGKLLTRALNSEERRLAKEKGLQSLNPLNHQRTSASD